MISVMQFLSTFSSSVISHCLCSFLDYGNFHKKFLIWFVTVFITCLIFPNFARLFYCYFLMAFWIPSTFLTVCLNFKAAKKPLLLACKKARSVFCARSITAPRIVGTMHVIVGLTHPWWILRSWSSLSYRGPYLFLICFLKQPTALTL